MVFHRDPGSVFDAPVDEVRDFLGSDEHPEAHRHREARREPLGENSGRYSWLQEFDGKPTRFAMEWTAYYPLGIAYRVLEGPFAGSNFFLCHEPQGARTHVTILGHFISGTLSESELEQAVDRFFTIEFDQDSAAIRHRRAVGAPVR